MNKTVALAAGGGLALGILIMVAAQSATDDGPADQATSRVPGIIQPAPVDAPTIGAQPDTASEAGTETPTRASSVPCDEGTCVELPGGEFDVRVNVGGQAYRDSDGNEWAADACVGGEQYTSPNEIDGTDDDLLFQSRRFEPQCSLPVSAGVYEVVVGWAETYNATPDYRFFPLRIEGREVAEIDVGEAVGMNTPLLETFEIEVRDGMLDIAAPERENRPMIALITAKRIGDIPPPSAEELAAEDQAFEAIEESGTSPEDVLVVSVDGPFRSLQAALDAVQPGQAILLADVGPTQGPVRSVSPGAEGAPITLTAANGAFLECPAPDSGEVARCFQLSHPYYVFDSFAIVGGSSNLYMIGDAPGSYVHDVKVLNSLFRGAPGGGTGECIRVKYQAYAIEIANNDIADCGLGKCCDDSKNGEGIYVGTAPEQLEEKNPSPEPDQTTDVWIHHNTIRSLNECVEGKEATYGILAEYNSCKGQQDDESAAFGSRGGLVGAGNTFRFNLIEDAAGACARFGGDDDPDGTGNDFYGNRCEDIGSEFGIRQQRDPQGLVCANTFGGSLPAERLSRNKDIDPTAPCPAGTPTLDGEPGAGRPNESPIDGF